MTLAEPSSWLLRWAATPGPGKTALDLACGSGRHLPHLLGLGYAVTGVDRDVQATAPWRDRVEIINADIEAGPWPLPDRRFDLVLVTNYLHRPLLPLIVASVAPGGWLIYETFAAGQEKIGRPARPDFLLQPGELIQACAALRVVAYEDLYEPGINPRYVQRIAATRPV
ncbi:MAG: class I SAM-dependent methyltransferase [Paucibacter sp.]|nr:class I SAM-dependent methyltransferase [Roseateles sp.]